MKKKITTLEELSAKVEITGKEARGWILATIKDVPFALKLHKPHITAWVQRVYVYPRKDGVYVGKNEYAPL